MHSAAAFLFQITSFRFLNVPYEILIDAHSVSQHGIAALIIRRILIHIALAKTHWIESVGVDEISIRKVGCRARG